VFPIELPPLRQREGDVQLLAQHFLDDLNREHGSEKVWAEGSLEQLAAMRWTGNVRELKNVVQRAFIMHDHEVSVPQAAEFSTAPAADEAMLRASTPEAVAMPGNWRQMTIKQVRDALIARAEERYLRALLSTYGGRIDRTASAAGIGTRALYDAMQRYGLRKEDFKSRGDTGEDVAEEAGEASA
jgi:DNA-binding NtrC family response regulator